MRFFVSIITFFVLLTASAAEPEVFFIPGWRTGFSARSGCVRILNDIYPGAKISVKSWNSDVSWYSAKKNADAFARILGDELLAMTDERRSNLVLIGHSVGAQILLDVICRLNEKGLNIAEIVFLGAALPYDDPDISEALMVSKSVCINIYSPYDGLLKILYPLSEYNVALGENGWKYRDRRFLERSIPEMPLSFFNHFCYIYLEELARFRSGALKNFYASVLPRGGAECGERDLDGGIFWKTVDKRGQYLIQRHFSGNEYRIVDAAGMVLSRGTEKFIHDAVQQK